MSSPIDELLISVGIEEGSNLEELHNMLQEIQAGGGRIEVEIADLPTRGQITAINRRITQVQNALLAELRRMPEITPAILEALNNAIANIQEVRNVVTALQHGILEDLFRVKQSTDILTNSLGWIETSTIGSYKLYEVGREMVKVINEVFEFLKANLGDEGFAEELNEKLDRLKEQCVKKEVQDMIFRLRKIKDYLPSIKRHTTQRTNEVINELNDSLLLIKNATDFIREKLDTMRLTVDFDIEPFIEEINFLSRNLESLLDGVMAQWVDRIVARDIDVAELVRDMGGTYNTLLHHYLRQEIKIDRFTNLLGEKITTEAQEFAKVMEAIKEPDEKAESILQRVDAIQTHLNKLEENIDLFRRSQEALQGMIIRSPTPETVGQTGFEAFLAVVKILLKSPSIERATEEFIASPVIRAGIRNIESIQHTQELINVLGLDVSMAAQTAKIMQAIEEQLFSKFFRKETVQMESLEDIRNQQKTDSEKLDSIKTTVESTDDKLDRKGPETESLEKDEERKRREGVLG
jgi:hypothetical protein